MTKKKKEKKPIKKECQTKHADNKTIKRPLCDFYNTCEICGQMSLEKSHINLVEYKKTGKLVCAGECGKRVNNNKIILEIRELMRKMI